MKLSKIFQPIGFILVVILFSFKPKPANTNERLDINNITININDIGELATLNDGFNFIYDSQEFLQSPIFRTGLIMGTNPTQIYESFDNTNTLSSYVDGNFQEVTMTYEIPNKFSIFQKAYAWNDNNHQEYVIIEYQIKNIGTTDINQFYAGIFADWNIGNKDENTANWDSSNKLGYINPTAFGSKYAGITLLTENSANYYAFDNDGNNSSINIQDDFTDAEKFQALSSGIFRPQAGTSGSGNDVSQLLSASILGLGIQDSTTIAFALVVGDDLTELQQQATQAQQRFRKIKTSPTPIVEDAYTCETGGSTIIIPDAETGTLYRFYDAPPTETINTPIFEGEQLLVENINVTQTYYVTNIDSLYEGDYSTIQVKIANHTAEILTSQRAICSGQSLTLEARFYDNAIYEWQINGQTIGINSSILQANIAGDYQVFVTQNDCQYDSELITLTQEEAPVIEKNGEVLTCSREGVSYQWYINGIALLSAKERNIEVIFPGNYAVEVTLSNGCILRSNNEEIIIITGLLDVDSEDILIYPNPTQNTLLLDLPDVLENQEIIIYLFDSQGKQIKTFTKQPHAFFAIDVSDVKKGIYTIQLEGKKLKTINKKILIVD